MFYDRSFSLKIEFKFAHGNILKSEIVLLFHYSNANTYSARILYNIHTHTIRGVRYFFIFFYYRCSRKSFIPDDV